MYAPQKSARDYSASWTKPASFLCRQAEPAAWILDQNRVVLGCVRRSGLPVGERTCLRQRSLVPSGDQGKAQPKTFWKRNTRRSLARETTVSADREAAAYCVSHSELEWLCSANREKGLEFHWEIPMSGGGRWGSMARAGRRGECLVSAHWGRVLSCCSVPREHGRGGVRVTKPWP